MPKIIIDKRVIILNSKGVPGIHVRILKENCAYNTILNKKTFKIIDIIAPTPEYLKSLTDINQEIIKPKANVHETIDKKPKKEATPFPPLNLSHIGNMCPITEKKPQIDPRSNP